MSRNASAAEHKHPAGPSDDSSKSSLRDLAYRLADFADIAQQAEGAFGEEDLEKILELSLRMRQVRSAVARARSMLIDTTEEGATEHIELTARIAEATHRARHGNQLLEEWQARDVDDIDALLQSALGVVAYTDLIVPAQWSFDHDVFVIVGSGLEDVATVMQRLGQQRILVFCSEGDTCGDYPPDVSVARSIDAIEKTFALYGPVPPRRALTRRLGASAIGDDLLQSVTAQVNTSLEKVGINGNTIAAFGNIWLGQGIENLPHVARLPSIAALDGAFAGKPMIVVASGPSLAKNIDLIREFRDRAIVVTVSHSLAALAAAGITPDVVLTADSNLLQYHFENFPVESVGALVSGAAVNPALFELPARNHFTFGANYRLDRWIYEPLGENATLIGGGSVATNCLTLGLRLQCDPIVFVGLDLSFPGGKYYVDSNCDGDMRAQLSDDGERLEFAGLSENMNDIIDNLGFEVPPDAKAYFLPALDGGTVPTSLIFSEYHSWFVDAARFLGDTVRLVNATEGGAYIAGFEHCTLTEVLDEIRAHGDTFATTSILDECAHKGSSIKRLHTMRKSTKRLLRTIGRLRRNARRGIALINASQSGTFDVRKLESLEAQLLRDLRGVSMLSMPAQQQIHRALERAGAATELDELLAASRDLFRQIEAAAGAIAAPLLRATNRLG